MLRRPSDCAWSACPRCSPSLTSTPPGRTAAGALTHSHTRMCQQCSPGARSVVWQAVWCPPVLVSLVGPVEVGLARQVQLRRRLAPSRCRCWGWGWGVRRLAVRRRPLLLGPVLLALLLPQLGPPLPIRRCLLQVLLLHQPPQPDVPPRLGGAWEQPRLGVRDRRRSSSPEWHQVPGGRAGSDGLEDFHIGVSYTVPPSCVSVDSRPLPLLYMRPLPQVIPATPEQMVGVHCCYCSVHGA